MCYCEKQGFLRRIREMKLNLSEREWVGELGALVPEGKTRANNRSQEGQGAVGG